MANNEHEPTKDLIVKFIPKEVSDEEMIDLFSEFGTLTYYKFHSKQDMQIKMCFLRYKTLEQATTARKQLNNYRLKGYQRLLYCVYNMKQQHFSSKYIKETHSSEPASSTGSTSYPYQNTKSHSPDENSKMITVLVTHLEDTQVFWGQPILPEQTSQALEITVEINNYCQSVLNGEAKIYEDTSPIYYATKFADGKWYRTQIQKKIAENAIVLYIDYGNSSTEQMNELIPLPKMLCFPPICSKYSILDSQAISFNIKNIFDQYIHICPIEPHPTDPNCTVVRVSSVGGVECPVDVPKASAQSYKISANPTARVTDSATCQVVHNAYSTQSAQSYQQQTAGYSMSTTSIHTAIDTTSPMQQPNHLVSGAQLTPQYANVFTFPSVAVPQELPQQNLPVQQPLPPQYQSPQLQQNSAFQTYQKGVTPDPPLQAVSTISKLDQKYPHPKYDPLHGPELLNRYRQELEDVDDRMKATSGRVITLESMNSELRSETEFLKGPESFQQTLRTMTEKVREFTKIKRQMYSIQDESSLREIAQEVLSNRGRLSLSQMSEVVEVRSLQDQLADLTNLIQSNSDTPEEPLGQMIAQRDECRSKLIAAISSLIETFNYFPLEERCDELNARRERLTQVPGYSPAEPKPIDLTVCLETYESVQSFDWRELKLGQTEEGLEELSARLAGALRFYLKLLKLDPGEDTEGDEEDCSALIHKIVETAENDISALRSMEDVHAQRRETASSSLMEAIAYELNRELEEAQSIQTTILPELLLEQERLREWENNKPSLTKLLEIKKEIKKVRTSLRHLRVDFQEASDESHQEDIFMIGNKIRSVLVNFHQLLLSEHEELWLLAEQASLHFSELPILYPDIGLERQIKLGPIFNFGWELDYFGELDEVGVFQEPGYQTIFGKEPCLLREIKLLSVEQQSVLAQNITKLHYIQHKAVLKCDAFFLSKSGLKAFLKHPSFEGVNLIDFFQTDQSDKLSIKWLFSQILHGLSAIHDSGLHCKCLTGKDIFITTDKFDILITSVDLLSDTSGQQAQLMHQFDLFNFCTLALSLLTSYEQDVLNLQPANMEDLIRNSGLDDCTISFLRLAISKTTTAPFLVSQAYFADDELAKCASPPEQEADRSDEEEFKVEDESKKVESEAADKTDVKGNSAGGGNSSVEGDNEEIQELLLNTLSS